MDYKAYCLAQGDYERQKSNAVCNKICSVSISTPSSCNSSTPKSLVHRYAAINRHAKARLKRTIKYQKSQKKKAESSRVKTTWLELISVNRRDPILILNDEENLHFVQGLLSPNPNGLLQTSSKDPFQTCARSLDDFEYYLMDYCAYPFSDFSFTGYVYHTSKNCFGSRPIINSRANHISLLSI